MSFDEDAFQRFERAGWDAKASDYHCFYRALTAPTVAPLLDAAAVGAGMVVLDVGCGPGYVAAAARARGAMAVGLDQSLEMTRIAASTSRASVLVGDAQRLPVRDGMVDAVVGNFVLQHLPAAALALAEFERVLRPGGAIALTVWDDPDRCRFLGVFTDSVRLAEADLPTTIPVGPTMVASDGEYAAMFARAHLVASPVTTLCWNHAFAGADELWDGLLSASVRTAALITEQPPAIRQRIRRAYSELIRGYFFEGQLVVPISVKLITGSRRGQR